MRVLDTDPPIDNAFVTGGKYVYVYTGLIKDATSDDELAFVLSHELGHSLLKHQLRRKEDPTSTIASLAVLVAMISKKNHDDFMNFAKIATASYNRIDEQEADAIAAVITHRAGYDPLRGADFFSRMKRRNDKAEQEEQLQLTKMRHQVEQGQEICMQWMQQYRSSWQYQTAENAEKVNVVCRDAETRRLQYNQTVQQHNAALQEEQLDKFFSTHPQGQYRIATVAALNDYLNGRRSLQSLSKFQQSYRVIVALRQVNSRLFEAPIKAVAVPVEDHHQSATDSDLTEQLLQLKRARDKGLISDTEYEQKRQQILNRY